MLLTSSLLRGASAWALIWCISLASAGAHAETGEDHPAVARFPGATIKHYDFREYEEFRLILSKPINRKSEWVADKTLPLEGRVTYIHYEAPKSASPLQVFRNYQSSLRRSGFKELFVCERPCTEANLGDFKDLMKTPKHYLNYSTDNQFTAAQRDNTYVSLWVNDGGVWLHVVEKETLNDGLMGVTGDSPIAKALNSNGKVDVYGFQFDTGKAVLKDGSKGTLQELAKVLQDNPKLNIEIIGHTDDIGGPEANQKLSEARALAVFEALRSTANIDPPRMTTRGLGQTAPVAPNTNEANRAKNRRVEIVALAPAPAPTATPSTQSKKAQPQAPAPKQEAAAPAQAPAPAPEQKSGNLMDTANKALEGAQKLKNILGF